MSFWGKRGRRLHSTVVEYGGALLLATRVAPAQLGSDYVNAPKYSVSSLKLRNARCERLATPKP